MEWRPSMPFFPCAERPRAPRALTAAYFSLTTGRFECRRRDSTREDAFLAFLLPAVLSFPVLLASRAESGLTRLQMS